MFPSSRNQSLDLHSKSTDLKKTRRFIGANGKMIDIYWLQTFFIIPSESTARYTEEVIEGVL